MTIARQNQEALKRWQKNRFGMFIHWGLYALPARHEWVKSSEGITDKEMYVDAFRAENLRIGFYYSLLDWHHPHYTLDMHHPMRNNEEHQKNEFSKDMRKYSEYLHAQVRELLTAYGEIDFLWLDFSVMNHVMGEMEKGRDAWNSLELVRMVRELQPNVLINDRLDLLDVEGRWDFRTPEQIMLRRAPEENGKKVPWESCQTFSGSWGYHRDESSWKSPNQLNRGMHLTPVHPICSVSAWRFTLKRWTSLKSGLARKARAVTI